MFPRWTTGVYQRIIGIILVYIFLLMEIRFIVGYMGNVFKKLLKNKVSGTVRKHGVDKKKPYPFIL